MTTILISFQDTDGAMHASRLRSSLLEELPTVDVLTDSIDAVSALWDEVVIDLLIAIFGPAQPLRLEEARPMLIDRHADFVRQILARGVPVVPVLIRGAAIPATLEPLTSLGSSSRLAPVELRHNRWGQDVRTLVQTAERLLAVLPITGAHLTREAQSRKSSLVLRLGLLNRLDLLRRRLVPRDRTWQLIVRGVVLVSALASLVIVGAVYRWHQRAAVRRVESLASRLISTTGGDDTKRVLEDMAAVVSASRSPGVNNLAVHRLKEIVLDQSKDSASWRKLRMLALSGIQTLRQNDISRDFMARELRKARLMNAKLAGAILRGVDLESANLAGAVLDGADLSAADLSGVYISHASVRSAKFTGAEIDELDWFNAAGFTEVQLASIVFTSPESLERCPIDSSGAHAVAAFERRFDDEYKGGYKTLSKDLQEWLSRVWTVYRAPSGLCEVVDRWVSSK